MRLHTLGFTRKRAETFFRLLGRYATQRLVDTRLKPGGQLSGFAQKQGLPYFLSKLAGGCQYVHGPVLAPDREILQDSRAGGDWARCTTRFEAWMNARGIPGALDRSRCEALRSCLLCSEVIAQHCRRGIVAKRLAARWHDVEIIRL